MATAKPEPQENTPANQTEKKYSVGASGMVGGTFLLPVLWLIGSAWAYYVGDIPWPKEIPEEVLISLGSGLAFMVSWFKGK